MTGSPARPAPPTAAVLTTVLTISALYAPQPLLPVLQAAFGVSREAAAALTTVTFVPLALAPLAYGLLLERVPAARVLQVAVLALAASEFAFAAADDFAVLLVLRVVQRADESSVKIDEEGVGEGESVKDLRVLSGQTCFEVSVDMNAHDTAPAMPLTPYTLEVFAGVDGG